MVPSDSTDMGKSAKLHKRVVCCICFDVPPKSLLCLLVAQKAKILHSYPCSKSGAGRREKSFAAKQGHNHQKREKREKRETGPWRCRLRYTHDGWSTESSMRGNQTSSRSGYLKSVQRFIISKSVIV